MTTRLTCWAVYERPGDIVEFLRGVYSNQSAAVKHALAIGRDASVRELPTNEYEIQDWPAVRG